MATQLNIKDAETVRMVREYASETGRSVTATVRTAIENDRRARQATLEEKIRQVNEIVDEVRRDMPDEYRGWSSKQLMDTLYDDDEPDGFAK